MTIQLVVIATVALRSANLFVTIGNSRNHFTKSAIRQIQRINQHNTKFEAIRNKPQKSKAVTSKLSFVKQFPIERCLCVIH
jgi:hypothetical protein